MCMYVYIYIYREREGDVHTCDSTCRQHIAYSHPRIHSCVEALGPGPLVRPARLRGGHCQPLACALRKQISISISINIDVSIISISIRLIVSIMIIVA